ncbi:MAG: V-type ATPase subunit [Candidatus Palauibacterales bacterium]|nr:V-type ATPase subunit [Candidatus Palauibacterales bacterium]MDP2583845.1 V-type ATPase subunit [Candidatus Palauibacterales bacterium]
MSGWWGDVNARARGLGAGLPSAVDLAALARERSVPGLARNLAAHGVGAGARPAATAAELDTEVRRWAAGHLALLRRRMGHRRSLAARVVLDDTDRRAVRALLRGAAEGAPAAVRLAGVIPSVHLPLPRLEELARCDSIEQLGDRLERLGHPAAAPLRAAPGGTVPDLFRLEAALDRAYARRALAGSRRGGDLLAFVREEIDLRNAWSILALSGAPGARDTDGLHLEGGERISPARFLDLCGTDPERVRSALSGTFGGGPLSDLFRETVSTAALERRSLELRAVAWTRRGRARPLGPAPFLAFALRLAASIHDLGLLVWGCALDAPPDRRLPTLHEVA